LEEGVVDIQLMNRPEARERQRQYGSDSGRFHNRAESLSEVDAWSLSESPNNPPALVPFQSAISFELMFENPFASDHITSRWPWKKIASLVGEKGRVLSLHCLTPIWVSKSNPIEVRDQ
jgi:hypothetical protein